MKDRFRFRVWNKKENSYGNYKHTFIGRTAFMSDIYDEERYCIEQCTGLKDKNDRSIYEGDIILSNIEYGGTYFVIVGDVRGYCYDAVAFEEYEKYLKLGKETFGGLSGSAFHIITDHGPCEVVGNIHENPELLEKKK